MKAYTDIKQSKKLAEILSPESSDMFWREFSDGFYFIETEFPKYEESPKGIRCWSLAALLDVLRFPILRYDIEDGEGGWIVSCEKDDKGYLSYYRDNPVDTCYEMIIKLHEQKVL